MMRMFLCVYVYVHVYVCTQNYACVYVDRCICVYVKDYTCSMRCMVECTHVATCILFAVSLLSQLVYLTVSHTHPVAHKAYKNFDC